MKILVLYFSTAIIFLAIDLVGLRLLVKPVFDRHIAHLFAEPFRMAPAAIFYFGYIAGVLFFVSLPALRANDPMAQRSRIGPSSRWPSTRFGAAHLPHSRLGSV